MTWALYVIIFFVCVYLVRHYSFTLNRLYGRQRHPYLDVDEAEWPEVTVMVPAHNEEAVISQILQALLEVDYPRERLRVMPVNDRSDDDTAAIIDAFAARHPDVVMPYERREGKAGKAAALAEAMAHVDTDLILVFDADYMPGRGLIKQLTAPFFDPEVGAVMGRVVPANVEENLLTRLLDLERAGGYQVDQQARMNLHLVPQYGGTVGGVRKSALMEVGGWNTDSLAEDTDATYRLLLGGWKTAYQNRSECYELVPERWPARVRQIKRWAKGHNQTMVRYFWQLVRSRRVGRLEKLDGLLLLGVYLMSPVMLVGWALAILLWFLGINKPGLIIILAVTSYSSIGNFATFFELATAARLDGSRERIRLLPFLLFGFLVSLFSVSRATVGQTMPWQRNGRLHWSKTDHNSRHNGRPHG
ncbi:MAG: glycosyltransferase family 2 protein [Candidatus Krumholzibacteriota bacterium]|nr:glycosyltransferase family 2 protein [Candidatus Krumholzibacteriota bacterium]